MAKPKLSARQYYSEFGRHNPLPDNLSFLKGVRPHFSAINYVLNTEGAEEIGVEYSIRNARKILNAIEDDKRDRLSIRDIKKSATKISELIDEVDSFQPPDLVSTRFRRRGDADRPSVEISRAEVSSSQHMINEVERLSQSLSALFDRLTKKIGGLERGALQLRKEDRKFERQEKKTVQTLLNYEAENKKLIATVQSLKAEDHEKSIKLGQFNTTIKGLEADIVMIKEASIKRENELLDEIELLKGKLPPSS